MTIAPTPTTTTAATTMDGRPATLYGATAPCWLSMVAAKRIARIGERRNQGIRPYLVEGPGLVWGSEELVEEWQQARPGCYWIEDGNGGAKYTSWTRMTEAYVTAEGILTGRTRTEEWRKMYEDLPWSVDGESEVGWDALEPYWEG